MAVTAEDIKTRIVAENADDQAVKQFSQSISNAEKNTSGLSSKLKGLGPLIRRAFDVAGIHRFVGALGDAVKAASDLDKGVREVGTLMGGLTNNEIRNMKGELEELSVATGQAIEPLVKAQYDIVSAGFSSAADAALVLESSARLAVGGVTDVATVADLTTTVLTAYGKSAYEVGAVHDDLFTIVRNGKTTMDELGAQMGALIATAGPLNVSLDEVGAGLSVLTSQGQATAIATTSLSAAIQTLSNPSKELVAALAAIDVESDNLIKTGGGLAGALELVQKASEETGIAVNKLVTREEALRSIMPLLSSASEKFAADLDSMANNAGAADAAFKEMAKSSGFLQDQVVRTFEGAQRAVGEAIISNEGYRQLLLDVKDAVGKFADKIREGDPAFEKFVSQVAMLGSAVVQNIPGYIDGVTGAVSKLNTVIIPLMDFVGRNPEVLEYGLIGLVVGGKKFAAVGAAIGSVVGFFRRDERDAESLADERMYRTIKMLENAPDIDITGDMNKGTDEWTQQQLHAIEAAGGDVIAALQAMNKAADNAKDALNGAGKAAGDAGKPIGGLGDKTKQAAAEAQAWEEALKAAQKSLEGTNDEILSVVDATAQHEAAEKALITAIAGGIKNRKAVEAATKAHDKAMKAATKSIEQYEKETDNANKAILDAQKFMRDHGATLDKHGISTDRITGLQRELAAEYRKEEPIIERITELYRLLGLEIDKTADIMSDSVRAYREKTADIVDAVGQIGTTFADSTGLSIQGIGTLQDAIENFMGDGTPGSSDVLQGVLGVTSFIGQNVGGRAGNIISSTAGMASAGASLATALGASTGNPIGAIIGGAVGLISSLFSNDNEERRARRNEARQEAFSAIQDMALEGGPLSAELMRRSGWDWENLSGMRATPDLAQEYGVAWPKRLMADYGVEGARDVQETITAIDNLHLSMKSFTDSGFDQALDKLNIKYEYLMQKSHLLSLSEEARLTELIQLVTGINADSVVSSISGAMSAAASQGGDAGEIFVQNFTNEILDGVANTAISQMVTNTIMPILEGPLSQIAQSMTAGEGFDASALAEAVSLAKSAAASVAPVVQELYAAFETSGMWAAAMGDNLNAVNDDLDTVVDKWTALIEEVTGVSASSVTSNIMSAISSMSDQGGDVGDAFVSNFMSSVMSGLQSYAVDQLVSTVIEPMMAPVMDRIANSISISDGIDEEGLSNALTQAEELAQNVAPFVEDLYGVFEEADFYSKPNQTPTADAREQEKQIEEAVRAATLEMSKELEDAQKKIAEIQEQSTRTSASVLQDAAEDAADSLLSAAEALRDYRTDLLANNLGKALGYEQLLRSQKGLVSELAAEALVGTRDSRVTAMQDIPGALRNYLGTFESMATDPLVYAREIAKASALIQGIEVEAGLTEQQATTEEVKQLREEVRQMTVTLAQHTAQTAQILKRWEMSGFETTPAS